MVACEGFRRRVEVCETVEACERARQDKIRIFILSVKNLDFLKIRKIILPARIFGFFGFFIPYTNRDLENKKKSGFLSCQLGVNDSKK